MSVTLRSIGAVATGTTSLVMSTPANTANGDLLLAFVVDHATSGNSAAPTGWNLVTSVASASGRFQVFSLIYGLGFSGQTGSSFTFNGLTTTAIGAILGYENADQTTPVAASSVRDNASGTTGTTSITPTQRDTLIVTAFASYTNGSSWTSMQVATNPSGAQTARINSPNGTSCSLGIADKAQSGAAAATGASSATMGTPGNNAGILLALNAITKFTFGDPQENFILLQRTTPTFTANVGLAPGTLAPAWGTFGMTPGEVGESYDMEWFIEGCATPVTYSVVVGSLPPGLSISSTAPALGKITGTPSTAGTYNFTVRATNAVGASDQAFTIVIGAADATLGGNFPFFG